MKIQNEHGTLAHKNSHADIYNVKQDNADVRRFAQIVNDSTAIILKQGYIDIRLHIKTHLFLVAKQELLAGNL